MTGNFQSISIKLCKHDITSSAGSLLEIKEPAIIQCNCMAARKYPTTKESRFRLAVFRRYRTVLNAPVIAGGRQGKDDPPVAQWVKLQRFIDVAGLGIKFGANRIVKAQRNWCTILGQADLKHCHSRACFVSVLRTNPIARYKKLIQASAENDALTLSNTVSFR